MELTDSPKRVLLVDDDRQQFLLIGYLLSEVDHTGYRLIWCEDLEEGLDRIEHHQCDVVLLDYHWGVNCKGFIQRANALNSRVPVIVMTDDRELEVDRAAISEGASDYLVKDTVNSEILERAMRYAMERKKIEHHLDHLAHYDYLTGLPNRVLFMDRLHQAVSLSHRSNHQFTLMYIDLNGFKEVNDTYGHAVGDQLLKEFAQRLQTVVRSSDTVARMGGDEFTILLNNMSSTPRIIYLAQKLIESIQQPFSIEDNALFMGCSIGIAVYPDAGQSVDVLQKNSDMAMYQAKQTGTSCYRFFSSQTKNSVQIEDLSPEGLHALTQTEQLSLSYTPRIDLSHHQLAAIEINPIWYHEKLGIKNYQDFGGLIVNHETIQQLTQWFMEQSFKILKPLYQQKPLLLSYPVRRSQLQSPQFCAFVKELTDQYEINIHHIEFTLFQHKDNHQDHFLAECIENITGIGANFGLHNFGDSALSLVNMHCYNISSLHFSPRFLKLALKNKQDAKLLETLIFLAHRLDKKVVANGLETNTHLELMRSIHCDYVQDGVVGNSLSFDELNNFLQETSPPQYKSTKL